MRVCFKHHVFFRQMHLKNRNTHTNAKAFKIIQTHVSNHIYTLKHIGLCITIGLLVADFFLHTWGIKTLFPEELFSTAQREGKKTKTQTKPPNKNNKKKHKQNTTKQKS